MFSKHENSNIQLVYRNFHKIFNTMEMFKIFQCQTIISEFNASLTSGISALRLFMLRKCCSLNKDVLI